MSDNTPATVPSLITAPTRGEMANALRIRDELADRIHKVSHPGYRSLLAMRVDKMHARTIAERLIGQGIIDLGALHAAIISDDEAEEDEEDLFDD